MRILAISFNYPHISRPYSGVFVKNTLAELVKLGHQITVIAPQKYVKDKRMPFETIENEILVLRPSFFSFGAVNVFGINSNCVTQFAFNQTVLKTIKKRRINAEIIYSHFLLPAGLAALKVSDCLNKKSICTIGESNLSTYESFYSKKRISRFFSSHDGLIFNSNHTKLFAENFYNAGQNFSRVIPNGVDRNRFYPRNKTDCRKKLKLPLSEKIVIFVGSFIERKGPLRVQQACERLANIPRMIFFGQGTQQPRGINVLFAGNIDHTFLPDYLCSADVFVLPTTSEGMPNSLLEAMACGIPVVTSPIEPNLKLLGESYPFYCNPLDINSISEKILQTLDIPQMNYPNVFYLADRAKLIDEFIRSVTK